MRGKPLSSFLRKSSDGGVKRPGSERSKPWPSVIAWRRSCRLPLTKRFRLLRCLPNSGLWSRSRKTARPRFVSTSSALSKRLSPAPTRRKPRRFRRRRRTRTARTKCRPSCEPAARYAKADAACRVGTARTSRSTWFGSTGRSTRKRWPRTSIASTTRGWVSGPTKTRASTISSRDADYLANCIGHLQQFRMRGTRRVAPRGTSVRRGVAPGGPGRQPGSSLVGLQPIAGWSALADARGPSGGHSTWTSTVTVCWPPGTVTLAVPRRKRFRAALWRGACRNRRAHRGKRSGLRCRWWLSGSDHRASRGCPRQDD